MHTDKERNKAITRNRLFEIKNLLSYNHTSYHTMNTMDANWKLYKNEMETIPELDSINISHPLYSKLTDKQYIFNRDDSEDVKKELTRSLDKMLECAESVVNAINELNIKSASPKNEKFVQRRLKLIELMIKSGKIDLKEFIKSD